MDETLEIILELLKNKREACWRVCKGTTNGTIRNTSRIRMNAFDDVIEEIKERFDIWDSDNE